MLSTNPVPRRWQRSFAAIFLLLALIVISPSRLSAQNNEFRGFWVDAWGAGFFNSTQVAKLVSDCTNYNFNAVVVQMRRRGDAFYMPQGLNGEPRTTALAANYDALQELITQCHNSTPRIEVHVWVTSMLVWSDANNPPSQAGHVYNAHPEYLMQNSAGNKFMSEGFYLDPGHPDAMTWNYNMAQDVVSRYDIEGFHWDYIRYPTTDSGFNPTAVARYNAEFGLSGQPSASDLQFADWRRRQVTDFLRWANSDLLGIKSNLVVSCSVFGSRSDAFNARYQDWAAWNSEGIIDICMPMGYTADNSLFRSRADDAYNNRGVRWIYQGQGSYLNTAANTVYQLGYARSKPDYGTMFYSYRTPNSGTVNQTATFTHVRDNHQPTWVNTPTIPWKAAPTKALLKGTVTRSDNGAGIYNATMTLTGASSRTQKTEAHGKYGFFETVPGSYTIEVTTVGLGTITTNVSLVAGEVKNVNIVVPSDDRFPPVISNIIATNITDTSATILWKTDEPSDNGVEFGTSTNYSGNVSNSLLVINHSMVLSNLEPNTVYSFRVRSADASGNRSLSGNRTFTTLTAGSVADIIIDNPSAVFTGAWTSGTSATDKFGVDYRFASGTAPGTKFAEYFPNIVVPGNYSVYEWHSQGSNRTLSAPYTIIYNGGFAETVYINQQINGGRWNLLGTYYFDTDGISEVMIDNAIPSGSIVMADAVKFVFIPPPPDMPELLTAVGVSPSQINLQWRDSSTNEKAFVLSRSIDPLGPYEPIGSRGANITNYSDIDLLENTTYYYVVRATNSGGESPDSIITWATTLIGPPVILRHPQGQTVIEGQSISMDVSVRAISPTYQWQFNFVSIPGATNTSLVITNATAAYEGEFTVVVTTAGGTAVSDVAFVRINFPLNVITGPGGTVVKNPDQAGYAFNDSVELTAVPDVNYAFVGWSGDATGTNNPISVTMDRTKTVTAYFMTASDIIVDNPQATYSGSWTLGSASADKYGTTYHYANTIKGSTATAQAFFRPTLVYGGKYNVFITSPGGSTHTTNAQLAVFYQNGTNQAGLNQTSQGGIYTWKPILSAASFVAGNTGHVRLSNNTGETNKLLMADAVRFSLVNPPSIITQPESVTADFGAPVQFGVLASGTGLAYQWQRNGTNIAGATGTGYSTTANHVTVGNYNVVVSNEVAVVTSQTAALNVTTTTLTRLSNAGFISGQRFSFLANGEAANYVIEGSSNLVDWLPLTNISITSGSVPFIDEDSTNYLKRYYRMRVAP